MCDRELVKKGVDENKHPVYIPAFQGIFPLDS